MLCATQTLGGDWKAVEGARLRSLFLGKELGDDVHYAYTFRADGTFSGTEMAKEVRGTWRVTKTEICWTWTRPRGAEECYQVETAGSDVRLLRKGAIAYFGILKPAH